MIYDSHQDFATSMARIEAITLGGDPSMRAWRHTHYRTLTNENQRAFERHLHDAMGYKRSTVNDWGV